MRLTCAQCAEKIATGQNEPRVVWYWHSRVYCSEECIKWWKLARISMRRGSPGAHRKKDPDA